MKKLSVQKPIVLTGFMAVGKTTVGRLIATSLGWDFVDTDVEISKEVGMSIEQIFARHGEAYFREQESTMIKKLLTRKQIVISTGGGLPCNEENSKTISELGQSVYISLGIDRIWQRLLADAGRPLVKGKTPAELRKFIQSKLSERIKYYNRAQVTVMGYGSPEQVAVRIIRKLK